MNPAAEVFPPGEFLREELDARGWSQTEFAEILGRPVRLINELLAGKKAITPDTAHQIGRALGTSPDLWMNLEAQFQLSKARPADAVIARRAQLYGKFPVREVIRRGWVAANDDIGQLEGAFLRFYGLASLDEDPHLAHAARKTEGPQGLQVAWLARARQLAGELKVGPYDETKLRSALPRLAALRSAPEETRHVAALLADCGVRFLVIEPIPGSKIDGACFWLGDQPVVAMSLRLDRIDNFWFVLRHELEHVLLGHGKDHPILEVDLEGTPTDTNEEERLANAAGAEFCVARHDLTDFIVRVQPFFKEERVLLFAKRLQIHPGIVVGQLQRHLQRYDLFRKHQAKVRAFVTAAAFTDGWGVVHTD